MYTQRESGGRALYGVRIQGVAKAKRRRIMAEEQLMLIIGDAFSVCGNCDGNANPCEKRHIMEPQVAEDESWGCGVKWEYVSNDGTMTPREVQAMRTDLAWRQNTKQGITRRVEEKILKGIEVVEFRQDELLR